MVAAGAIRYTLVSSLISLPPSLAVAFAAAFLGVEAVALSALLTLPFQAAVAIFFICRQLGIRPRELAQAIRKSGIVALITCLAILAGVRLAALGEVNPLLELVTAAAFGALGWWTGLVVTRHPLLDELRHATGALLHRVSKALPQPVRLWRN
jgi:hypothetical protein